ncbi:hypothetical protein SRABI106_03263 [Rahnella aquatilis]|nr:hypothetical protein SRABI106_03263 [Rahnella aquatilis]
MLVVIGADIRIRHVSFPLHGRCIHFDVADFHLFRREETVFILVVECLQFSVSDLLFSCQRIGIQCGSLHITTLQNQPT